MGQFCEISSRNFLVVENLQHIRFEANILFLTIRKYLVNYKNILHCTVCLKSKRGRSTMRFCKLLYHRKCKRRGVGGQNRTNLVNVVCERPLNVFMKLSK